MSYSCYVYIIECGGFLKIGMSKDPSSRARSINTSTPFEVKTIKTFGFKHIDEAKFAEKLIHETLSDLDLHKKLEWFSCSESQALSVCSECCEAAIKIVRGRVIGKREKALNLLSLLNLSKTAEITNISENRLKDMLDTGDIEAKEATRILKLKERL